MPIDKFEDLEVRLTVVIPKDAGTIEDTTFKFEQSGGDPTLTDTVADQGESKENDDGSMSACIVLNLPKVKDDEDNYTLKYKAETVSKTKFKGKERRTPVEGTTEYKVWPKTINIKGTKDGDCKAELDSFTYVIAYPGQTKMDEYASDDKLAVTGKELSYTGDYTITARSPYYIKDWKKKKGRNQEATVGKKPWKAKIIAPADGKTEDAPHKQYVNLTGAGNGSLLEVQVGPTDLALGLKDEEIKVRVTFPKENSKRNDPFPALWLSADVATAQAAKKADAKPGIDELVYEAVVKLPADKGKVSFFVQLGVAGDDKCKVEVGTTDKYDDDVMHIVTSRKIYCQVTRPKGLACPDLQMTKDAFKKVGIEFEEYTVPAATYEDTADWIPAGAWLDESVFKKGASGNVLCIGTHNVDEFKKLFDKSKPPAAHLILCHYQLDAETTECDQADLPFDANDKIKFPPGSGTEVRGWSMPSSQIDPSCVFFKKALHNGGDPVVNVSWESTKTPLKKGDMAADDVIMDQAEHGNYVHIRLPEAAAKILDADATDVIKVTVKVYWSKGWYAGWCTDGDQHNVIKASNPVKTVNATIIHEVGHAIDQTVTPVNIPPGLEPVGSAVLHSRRYDGRGHSGSHCATGLDKTKYEDTGKTMSALGANSEATCTMYGAAVGNLDFCAECAPFAKASNPQTVST